MSNSQEIVAVAVWMMAGGAILAVFGFAATLLARNAGDRGGLSKPLTMVGMAIFALGFYLDHRWGTFW